MISETLQIRIEKLPKMQFFLFNEWANVCKNEQESGIFY